MNQLSERHSAALHKLGALEAKVSEQLEQLSERHSAMIRKLSALEEKVNGHLE